MAPKVKLPGGKRHFGETSSATPPRPPSRTKSNLDSRFPSDVQKHTYTSHVFKLMSIRSLDHEFFSKDANFVREMVDFYKLEKLVYCNHAANEDLLAEFYNNLQPTEDPFVYHSRVAKTDISISPAILETFLGYLVSKSDLELYPTLPEELVGYNLNAIHESFFHEPRNIAVNLASAMALSTTDNILYKVIVGCILPIVTKGQSIIRPHHLLALHLMKHHLDFNIALNMFLCIIHFSTPVKKKVYMPFGHILTSWFESLGINTSKGKVTEVKTTDYINWRNLALAGMVRNRAGDIVWKKSLRVVPHDEQEDEAQPPTEAQAHPDMTAVFKLLTEIRDDQTSFFNDVKARLKSVEEKVDNLAHEHEMIKNKIDDWMDEADG